MSKSTSLISGLKESAPRLSTKKITAGFDGFVDQIVKIIRYKEPAAPAVFFETKKQFADYIHEKEGTSFSMEVEEQFIKLGGNMPIMANALATLGFDVNCIGALGYPHIHPVFHKLSSNCKLFSFTDPGFSTAYEFTDGKMMMGHFAELHTTGWEQIKSRIGLETLIELYQQSELHCFVNWSEIDASTNIWKGLLRDVLPKAAAHRPFVFFDLSDCTKRSKESVTEALELIQSFGQFGKVVIGMNRNEARFIYKIISNTEGKDDLNQTGIEIYQKLQPSLLVLHSSNTAIAFDGKETYRANAFYVKHPLISTGAGDNFNAGFCTAQLLELDVMSSVVFANVIAGLYVRNGYSPTLKEAIDFLSQQHH